MKVQSVVPGSARGCPRPVSTSGTSPRRIPQLGCQWLGWTLAFVGMSCRGLHGQQLLQALNLQISAPPTPTVTFHKDLGPDLWSPLPTPTRD